MATLILETDPPVTLPCSYGLERGGILLLARLTTDFDIYVRYPLAGAVYGDDGIYIGRSPVTLSRSPHYLEKGSLIMIEIFLGWAKKGEPSAI